MKPRTLVLVLSLLATALAPTIALGCLWDRDTLATEASGITDVVNVIVGRFDRNPPLYYEMRLARVKALLGSNPGDLDAYDDAAVACDRLGRDDEALAWMDRKAQQLDAMQAKGPDDPGLREQRYRYLANTGTFWVHRWVRRGADRTKLAEVKTARDFIARAIELNPDAHFGREKYQLKTLDWLLAPPEDTGPDEVPVRGLDCIGFLVAAASGNGWPEWEVLMRRMPDQGNGSIHAIGYSDAEKGLAGLVTLGSAWESVDTFIALDEVLRAEGRSNVAELANCRVRLLLQEGRKSLAPEFPTVASLQKAMDDIRLSIPDGLEKDQLALIDRYFGEATKAAEERNQARQSFMLARLKAGRHPDTDTKFWDGYTDPPPPPMPALGIATRLGKEPGNLLMVIGVGGVLFAVILYLARRRLW